MLDKDGLVGDILCHGKNGYIFGGEFYSLFLAPEMIYCLTNNEFGVIEEHRSFKVFNDSKRLLDRSQDVKMIDGKKISAMLPKTWKKSLRKESLDV